MNNSYLTPERVRWLHTKRATLHLSSNYISIKSMEIWGGQYFSRTGWCVHAPRDASPQWIGENFRKAITTSEYFKKFDGPSLDRGNLATMKAESNVRRLTFNTEIAATYGYKTLDEIGLRCDLVFGEWHYLIDDVVILDATKRMPGGHRAWPLDKKYDNKRVHVPLSVTDEELGLAIRDAFSRCEAPGRQKINWPREEDG
ncbi:contact-dependent growth inhibition system immunity protein [Kozakia baliensis]|uniref:contact-dependent growth inhibition system immunity protein n=1 Tax=Kozakia baliensis TaxID=153496 RepID=UPI0009DF0134|nr:contact-dependent growth inhibition system immunity protein [Kozakia baliensis]